MVLQRDKAVKIFGFGGEAGETVTVNYKNQTKQAEITSDGWEVYLDAMSASNVGSDLTVTYMDNTQTFTNVVVGEVWLCSGQSNMEIDLNFCSGLDSSILTDYAQYNNFDKIRTVRIPRIDKSTATVNTANRLTWNTHTGTADSMSISATALAYALNLQAMLGDEIPVGVVISAVGGSDIRAWMDNETNANCDYPLSNNLYGSAHYNGMTHNVAGMTIGGMLWYQGEANSGQGGEEAYKSLFRDLVEMYRRVFENPSLPIITCQLVQLDADDDYGWAEFRQAQWDLAEEMDGIYTVCGIDCGDNSPTSVDVNIRIHPADKWPIGQRAAAITVKEIFGISYDELAVKSAYGNSPDIISATQSGNKITLTVRNATALTADAGNLDYFEVYNGSAWVAAEAEISGNKVILTTDATATKVRYLYRDIIADGTAFIRNEYGLPLAPASAIAVN